MERISAAIVGFLFLAAATGARAAEADQILSRDLSMGPFIPLIVKAQESSRMTGTEKAGAPVRESAGKTVVFQQSRQKRSWDFFVDDTVFFTDNGSAGITVKISNFQSQPENIIRYEDDVKVPGLSFDPAIGAHGAIVYADDPSDHSRKPSKTICAYKSFFRYKETGSCPIDFVEKDAAYTVRLSIK